MEKNEKVQDVSGGSAGLWPPPPLVEKDPRVDMAITLLETAIKLLYQLDRPIYNKPTWPEPPENIPFGDREKPE